MAIEIKAPTFPESVADGTVATWHKQPGDAVKRDDLIVDIETDKVVLEVLGWALSSRTKATPFCPTKSWAPSKRAALLPLQLLPLLLPLHKLLLQPLKAKMILLLHRLLASWLKKTASTSLPLPAPAKAVV